MSRAIEICVWLAGTVTTVMATEGVCFAQRSQSRFDDHSVMVRFEAGTDEIDRQIAQIVAGGEIEWESQYVWGICLIRLHQPGAVRTVEMLRGLSSLRYAELCPVGDLLSAGCSNPSVPNDTLYGQQWALKNTGQFGGTAGSDIDVECAWTITKGAGQTIGVIDNGFGSITTGAEFGGQLWTNNAELNGIAGVDDDGNGFKDDVHGYDFNMDSGDIFGGSHGTQCAGLIVAKRNNTTGISGVAPDARAMILKVSPTPPTGFEPATPAHFMKAVEYAYEFGVRIFSISKLYEDYSQAWYDHCKDMGDLGVLFVVGAGNTGVDLDLYVGTGYVPATFGTLSNVITVAGSSPKDQLCSAAADGFSSNHGSTVCLLAAPSSYMLSTGHYQNSVQEYVNEGGTSFGTPCVAAVAAMVRSVYPTWTPAQIKTRIGNSARSVTGMGAFTQTGGVLNAWNAVQ